jgi:hypothetical protein
VAKLSNDHAVRGDFDYDHFDTLDSRAAEPTAPTT